MLFDARNHRWCWLAHSAASTAEHTAVGDSLQGSEVFRAQQNVGKTRVTAQNYSYKSDSLPAES